MEITFVLVAVWWTFVIVCFMSFVEVWDSKKYKDVIIVLGLSVFWPVMAVCAVPWLIYKAMVASTAQIRVDLKNRGTLREFEAWLAQQDKQK